MQDPFAGNLTAFINDLRSHLEQTIGNLHLVRDRMRDCGVQDTCQHNSDGQCVAMQDSLEGFKSFQIRERLVSFSLQEWHKVTESIYTKMFLYPRIRNFLESRFKPSKEELDVGWRFESKIVPQCIDKCSMSCQTRTQPRSGKKLKTGKCFDFAFLPPFPYIVAGEVKVLNDERQDRKNIKDLAESCLDWLAAKNLMKGVTNFSASVGVIIQPGEVLRENLPTLVDEFFPLTVRNKGVWPMTLLL